MGYEKKMMVLLTENVLLKEITLCTQVQHCSRPRMPANKTGQTELLIYLFFFIQK